MAVPAPRSGGSTVLTVTCAASWVGPVRRMVTVRLPLPSLAAYSAVSNRKPTVSSRMLTVAVLAPSFAPPVGSLSLTWIVRVP